MTNTTITTGTIFKASSEGTPKIAPQFAASQSYPISGREGMSSKIHYRRLNLLRGGGITSETQRRCDLLRFTITWQIDMISLAKRIFGTTNTKGVASGE